jgi:hypothetical protein
VKSISSVHGLAAAGNAIVVVIQVQRSYASISSARCEKSPATSDQTHRTSGDRVAWLPRLTRDPAQFNSDLTVMRPWLLIMLVACSDDA